MSKKQFVRIMKEIISFRKDTDDFNEAFKKLEPEFNYISFGRIETLVVDTLKIAMDDKYDWVDYFIYECDYGKDKELLNSVTQYGKKVPLKTLGNLYDFIKITNNYDKNKGIKI